MNYFIHNKSATALLFKWLSQEKKAVYKIYFLALLQGVLYIAIPLGIQGIITFTMAGKFSASLILLCLITILATFFIGILQLWQMRLNETLQEKVFSQLTDRISKLLHLNSENKVSQKLSYFFEVITLQKGIGKILLEFSFSLISIVFGLIILPAYSNWFLFFSIILGLVFYLIVTRYGKKALAANLSTSLQKYNLYDWFNETSETHKYDDSKTDTLLFNYLKHRKEYYKVFELQYKGILLFKVLFVSILLFLGAFLVQIGELNIGQFVASEIIVLLVINSIEKLIGSLGTCYDIITALSKIEELFKDNKELSFLNEKYQLSLISTNSIYNYQYSKKIKTVFYSIVISSFVILFLPWTQNIESYGRVTTLSPENRPQTITSRIPGRIEKWFIKEGDFVKKNDTIAFISEIKDEYVDPMLIGRSEDQIKAKETTLESYEQKINAVNLQVDALSKSLRLKTEQARNKIIQAKIKVATDSLEANAAVNNYHVAEEQLKRYEELLSKGVISKTDLENRKIKVQEAIAKKTSAENKFMSTKNEFLNAEIELNSVQQDYNEKLMKVESDKFSAMSALYEAEGSLTKLQGQLSNYSMRKGFYYVLAPQDGYIARTTIQGIGEIIKEGAPLCYIVPKQTEQVVELYVNPVDLPLINKGQNVQLIFDGWPAFVFSGWPGISFGSYSAEIVAFDRVLSDNGKFRILAKSTGKKWPDAIQIGSGVEGFTLLNNVPLIYEFWRKINGFPPEFYMNTNFSKKEKSEKK